MILGVGNDMVDIRRIEQTLERFGDRFVNRIFTDVERAKSDRRHSAQRLMPSGLLPRRRVQRRLERAFAEACSGVIWAW
jgi:holo-[acyl-carrier-protein] synthase